MVTLLVEQLKESARESKRKRNEIGKVTNGRSTKSGNLASLVSTGNGALTKVSATDAGEKKNPQEAESTNLLRTLLKESGRSGMPKPKGKPLNLVNANNNNGKVARM